MVVKPFHPNSKKDQSAIIKEVLNNLIQGKWVVVTVCSKNLGKKIVSYAWQFIDKSLIKFYHGDQYNIEEDGMKHKARKEEDFKDVRTCWKSIKLLIYTGTLTCGVDYTVDYQD